MLIEILAVYFSILPVLIALVIGGYCADKIEDSCKHKRNKIKHDYK